MIDQIVIGVCGIASCWLSQDRRPEVQRWACIFGIVAQPAWLYSSWNAGQWGIFVLSLVYAAGWIRGFINFWVKR